MEYPILFNASMVQAILAGRKTQTRRIVKPSFGGTILGWGGPSIAMEQLDFCDPKDPDTVHVRTNLCPYGKVGDRLWVKEAWRFGGIEGWSTNPNDLCTGCIEYESGQRREVTAPDFDAVEAVLPEDWDWDFPDIDYFAPETMPQWASYIDLENTEIRVERLQDISQQDAVAEGVILIPGRGWYDKYPDEGGHWHFSAKDAFKTIWESIYGPDSWAANPWVWVVSFLVVQGGDL